MSTKTLKGQKSYFDFAKLTNMEKQHFTLTSDNLENIGIFSEILKTDTNGIINKALEEFFENEQKKLLEKNIENENAMTNLDFNEFWDDVEI